MARFILDFMVNVKGEDRDTIITSVLNILERDELLSQGVTSIRCIDETNDNQFYSHDNFISEDGHKIATNPMMNVLSEKQLENDREILLKY
tara:strand:- start:26 stop:298 length:273 start_codon:yes stop_codon:yes gene_type:complete